MKKITLSLLAVAASCTSIFSQVVLQENFTSPFNVTAAGWGTLNLSGAIGGIPSWFQGVSNNFPAYNGGPSDYYAAHYNNGAGTTTISNWLFTPVVTIENGAELQFYTRSSADVSADRLQIRFSTAGANMSIPAGPTSVGTFSNMMLDINPLYTLATTSAVANGSVNGYPGTWTVYNLTVTGVPVATTGRFAFRYFVENGGPSGTNGNYIGIDAVKYTLPCGPTINSYTTCAGFNTTLTAMGLSTTTYSWNTGSTNQSIVVNPAATTVYTLTPSANGVACPNPVTATITTAAQMAVNIVASATTICSGGSAILTAIAPAPNYTWTGGGNTSVITITPSASGVYSVNASNGTAPNVCLGNATININVIPSPTLTVTPSYENGSTGSCINPVTFTLTASGANLYNYIFGSNVFTTNPSPLTNTAITTPGSYTFIVLGQAANGCISGIVSSYSVHPTPTVVIAASPSTAVCVNKTLTLTASGAATYKWNNATSTLTANPYTVNTGNTSGTKTYVVFGKSAGGCTASASRTVAVSACTGVEDVFGDVSSISAFPNPFSNEINVTGFNGRVEIYNAIGQLVYGTKVVERETINTSDFAKGVYMLKSYDGQGEEVKTIKLIKN